ncbi:YhcH/YjgK/YiaL family protein [Mucilaginibacter sp. BJC16-A38]|uniref:YhcH/YjgK/YiaL family protein n=1 Tax=Mucilaginibacter phenanthrenivorans TaxID=1234842 RepID=UPI0021587923|nr:YhcH/YjgK/YiaL family protein [Mucilaginibacter phenanthrenivorans]MCR8556639.1 YhcH/YjgK/YiaL family protein [Mucilaginibacter phenanthrenivorans]
MKTLIVYRKLTLLFIFLGFATGVLAQVTWTESTATAWLSKKEWKNGLKLDVHSSVNKVVFAEQYHKNQAMWDKAFAFLRDSDLTKLKPGKYPIDGTNVYAAITEAPSKEFENSAWESHRKYIDLQYVIKGQETIGVAPVSKATVTKPYNEASDNANYNVEGQYYIAMPGTFFLFFPGDAHRPNIKVAGYDVVKKIVIKIKVAE